MGITVILPTRWLLMGMGALKPRRRTDRVLRRWGFFQTKVDLGPTAKQGDWQWTPKIGGDKDSSRSFWASRSGWPSSPSHSRSHSTGQCADSVTLFAPAQAIIARCQNAVNVGGERFSLPNGCFILPVTQRSGSGASRPISYKDRTSAFGVKRK
jgi:hypothetical protein